jgi:hypothetical protein
MADSSRHALHYIAEVTYGTTPATPNFKGVRHTGTNLAMTKSTTVSEELRADRQITDFRHGTKQTGGDISGELSSLAYDDFLQAVLGGTWTVKAAPRSASTLSTASADNSINDSANGLPLLTAGDKVTLSGFTAGSSTNNATFSVVSSTAAKMVLAGAVPLVTQAAGTSYTVTTLTQVLKAGTVRRSFSVLRNFSDMLAATKPYHLFTGVEFNKLSLSVAVNAIDKISFGVVGKDFSTAQTAPAGSAYTAAPTASPMDSFTGSLSEGGTPIAVITEISMNLENGIEPRFVIGSDSTILPSIGKSNCTGQITAYFEDATLIDKFINETESSLVFNLADKDTNSYRFTLPRIKYTGGQPDTQGAGPITLAMPFQALLDSVSSTNLTIERN